MSIQTDLTIDASKFALENVSESTTQANTLLEKITTGGPRWYDVGAAKYREMHMQGKIALPPPVSLPNATSATVPARENGREIPIRVYKPDNGRSKGVFLHSHGGGFVLGSETSFDKTLQMYANGTQLTAVSVGYRHAPEAPYPAPLHDCLDTAEYLVDHPEEYGEIRFLGGESAGANLSVNIALHLFRSRPSHSLSGLVLQYGLYDLSMSMPAIKFARPLMLDGPALAQFIEAYTPGLSNEERRDPLMSPLYADLSGLAVASKGLPPALFVCGTADLLVDENLLMGARWSIAGGESIVKLYPGAGHGFTALPGLDVAEEACEVSLQFIRERM
ncbi:Alpha/Beta hydrolase protein [Aspergillus californicus]